MKIYRIILVSLFGLLISPVVFANYNVRDFGAKGDDKTIDSPAINRAIEAASQAGGGTVFFPAGTYLSYSIRLSNNIHLYFDEGAVLKAARPSAGVVTRKAILTHIRFLDTATGRNSLILV